jgi:hypothetical protein
MDVRVICALPPWNRPENDYVRVLTRPVPDDETVVLATIERIVDKDSREPAERSELTKRVKTLISRRMTPNEALVLATSYAERKKIPVVYADQG